MADVLLSRLCALAIECPPPDLPLHVRQPRDKPRNTYGSTLIYDCDTGHELISGDLERSCGATGKWSGREPLCRGKPSYLFGSDNQ